jgi:hypothetical protein
VEAARIVVSRSPLTLYGDQALIELGARRAAHFDQLVGPYSRDGFHHPGPVLFYLLAPFVRIFTSSGAGLYLGAIAISGAALTATVAFLWRRVGPLAALSAVVAIDLFCLCVRVGTLREPWNPYLIVAPMVLFVVLWAAGITGSAGAGLWSLVIGSYLVQTHIATAGVVITMTAIFAAHVVRSRWRRRSRQVAIPHGWRPARITGLVVLVLVWIPSLVELWRDQPNNLRLLWGFFTSTRATPPLQQSLTAVADAWTIVPFGNHDYVLALHRSPTELGVGVALLLVGLALAVELGCRRRQPLTLALASAGGLGVLVGTISLALSPPPVYPYYTIWLAYVPVSIMLAIGVAILAPGERPPHPGHRADQWAGAGRPLFGRRVVIVCAAAAVIAATFTVHSDLRMGPIRATTGSGPWPPGNAGAPQGRVRTIEETSALGAGAEGVLRPTDRSVTLTIGTPSLWPYAAGIVLQLDRHGVQSTVAPASWALYFGQERAPGRPVSVTYFLYAPSDPMARMAGGDTVIVRLDGAVLTYHRTPG